MGKCHPFELRSRVVDFVEEGHSHRSCAAHFRVSIKFVNDMVKLKRETGALVPKLQGRRNHGKLANVQDWLVSQLKQKSDFTIVELLQNLQCEHGITVNGTSLWRRLRQLEFTHKKRFDGS